MPEGVAADWSEGQAGQGAQGAAAGISVCHESLLLRAQGLVAGGSGFAGGQGKAGFLRALQPVGLVGIAQGLGQREGR